MKYCASYYKVRRLCHELKKNNPKAIEISALLLSRFVKSNDIVIPMPSHYGYATYMLDIANKMHNICGCKVLNILSSDYHKPWYNTKRSKGINSDLGYDFELQTNKIGNGNIYIIDNVYSSGKTMRSAINKVKNYYQNNNVDGIVIGYVDNETINALNYGPDLHENKIAKIIKNYLKRNII